MTGFDSQVQGRATAPVPGACASQYSLVALFCVTLSTGLLLCPCSSGKREQWRGLTYPNLIGETGREKREVFLKMESALHIQMCSSFLSFTSKTLWPEQKGLWGQRQRIHRLHKEDPAGVTRIISGGMGVPEFQDRVRHRSCDLSAVRHPAVRDPRQTQLCFPRG